MAALLAVASALTFGAADFAGGMAARRGRVLGVTTLAQAGSIPVLVVAMSVVSGTPSWEAAAAGAVAGIAGAGGLVLYLRALAIGPMGVAAPLAGVTGAVLPVATGLAGGDRPGALAYLGIAVGLGAVALAAGDDLRALRRTGSVVGRGTVLALISGVGFGVFFVAMDASPTESGLWPLLAARVVSLALLVAALRIRRSALPSDRSAVGLAIASGVLDMTANALFLAATRTGLLSLTALLSSLYPVVVAALAAVVLRERLDRVQLAGIALALGAVAMIAVG